MTETPVTMTCRFTVENSLANQRVTCINKMVDGQSCSYDQDDNECKCPTKKDECPNKSQCTWHAGQCIHKTEKIYLGLDARLKMRGKTDLALQIFYNKKPARISAPYGQFGYFQVDAFKVNFTLVFTLFKSSSLKSCKLFRITELILIFVAAPTVLHLTPTVTME